MFIYLMIGSLLVLMYESLTMREGYEELRFTYLEGFATIIFWPIILLVFVYYFLRGGDQ